MVNIWKPVPNWRNCELHWIRQARALALAKAGSSIAARMAMIAITTSNSIRVKPRLDDFILPASLVHQNDSFGFWIDLKLFSWRRLRHRLHVARRENLRKAFWHLLPLKTIFAQSLGQI